TLPDAVQTPGGNPEIRMLSADEGWLVANPYIAAPDTVLLHYVRGVWTRVPYPYSSSSDFLDLLQPVAPGEMWVAGVSTRTDSGFFAHYLNGQWQRQDLPHHVFPNQIVMSTPTDGLAVAVGIGPDAAGNFASVIYHYDGLRWKQVDLKPPM